VAYIFGKVNHESGKRAGASHPYASTFLFISSSLCKPATLQFDNFFIVCSNGVFFIA
jgi:hypothetical protein